MTVTGLFERLHEMSPRALHRLACLAALVLAMPFLIISSVGIRINCSPSLPLGFYIKTNDRYAPLVEFCPQEPYASFAASRGYRPAGNCPDGAGPLMKPAIASAGDLVELSSNGLAVNGSLLPNTAPRTKDSKGRPMQPYKLGQHRVPAGFVWVASSYNSWSFDSRYFGPIQTEMIRGRLRPLLTF